MIELVVIVLCMVVVLVSTGLVTGVCWLLAHVLERTDERPKTQADSAVIAANRLSVRKRVYLSRRFRAAFSDDEWAELSGSREGP